MDPEVQRLIGILRTTMRILGVTNRDIERKLGLSPSYLSRLFSGGIELKAEHLVNISKAMGLEPAEFFHIAYPRRPQPSSHAAEQIREVLRNLGPPPPPESQAGSFSEEQMAQLREMMRQMMERER